MNPDAPTCWTSTIGDINPCKSMSPLNILTLLSHSIYTTPLEQNKKNYMREWCFEGS